MISVDEVNGVLELRNPMRDDRNKFNSKLLFQLVDDLDKREPDAPVVSKALLYYSRLRPTSASSRIPGVRAINDRWWYADKALSPDTIIRFDLQPFQWSLATFLWDAARELKIPIEMTETRMVDDGFRAAVLFINPQRKYQMSWFQDGIGPTGHIEGSDPVQLLRDAIYEFGFKYWTLGVIDMIGERMS
jgi:hypothetical protein